LRCTCVARHLVFVKRKFKTNKRLHEWHTFLNVSTTDPHMRRADAHSVHSVLRRFVSTHHCRSRWCRERVVVGARRTRGPARRTHRRCALCKSS
jgi:hypothetical protein